MKFVTRRRDFEGELTGSKNKTKANWSLKSVKDLVAIVGLAPLLCWPIPCLGLRTNVFIIRTFKDIVQFFLCFLFVFL